MREAESAAATPPLPEREETGDEKDECLIRPPSLLGPPPWPMESLVTPHQLFTEVIQDQGDQ